MVDAGDDEWETPGASSADDGVPAPGGPASRAPADVPPHPWGPPLLDSDSWETVPLAPTNRGYEGRRRADAVTNRRWLVVGAVLAGLAAVIAIPLVLTSGDDGGVGVAAPTLTAPPVARSSGPTSTTTLSSTGEAAQTSSPPSSTNAGSVRTTTTRPTTSKAQPPLPAFQPLTFEGERADLDGSAAPYTFSGASGGQVAYRIGDWDDRAGDGVLTIRNIAIPTGGRYRITLFTVHPDGESQRFGRLTVTGVNTITLTFNGGSNCCQTTNVDVDLTAGSKTLTFTHSNRRAPSVDRIVISRL